MAYDPSLERLPDPVSSPSGPGWNKQSLQDNIPGMVHPLNGPKVLTVQNGGQYFKINITYPDLTQAEFAPLRNFLYTIQGAFKPFYIQLPNLADPVTGQWSLTTNTEKGVGMTLGASNKLVIPNQSGLGGSFTPGDALKLSNSNKIYIITKVEVVTTTLEVTLNCDIQNTSTLGTAELEPNDVRFRVKLEGNLPSIDLDTSGLTTGLSLSMRESI